MWAIKLIQNKQINDGPQQDKIPSSKRFVQGRSIHDNILIAHGILHSFQSEKRKKKIMAIMEKAFIGSNGNLLKKALEKLASVIDGFIGSWNV